MLRDAESTRDFLTGGMSFPEKGRFSPTIGLPHLELFALNQNHKIKFT